MNRMKKQLTWVNLLLIPMVLFSCNNARQRSMDNPIPVADSIIGDMESLFPATDTITKNRDIESLIPVVDTMGGETPEGIIEGRNIVHFETIMLDTIIGDFFISYIVKDNDDIINDQIIYGTTGDTVQVEYADRSVFLDLKHRNGQTILSNKEINKYTFKSIVPQDGINQYQLWYFGIEKVDEEGVLFDLNICKPDTDNCYSIELYISKDGDITMSGVEPVWEDDYD